MRRKGNKMKGISVLLVFCLLVLIATGYVKNIIKLCKADFNPPYKEEIIRGAGIPLAPVGVVVGYIDFEKGKE